MTPHCEASGLKVIPNADGRGTCPLCGTDWHCLTKQHALRHHSRWKKADPVVIAQIALAKVRAQEEKRP